MLDLLEAGLAGLNWNSERIPIQSPVPEDRAQFTTAEQFRVEIEAGGSSPVELAAALGVSYNTMDEWLAGRVPVPLLALTSLQLLRRLTLSERPILNGMASSEPVKTIQSFNTASVAIAEPANTHPFSRIEDL